MNPDPVHAENDSHLGEAMTFRYKKFDVQVKGQVDPRLTSWPKPGQVADGRHPGGNRQYDDLRGCSWSDARDVKELEDEYIHRIEQAYKPYATELFDEEELAEIMGLDVGVASTVAALSAADLIPFTSCNAGAFGGRHHETYPMVVFYTQPQSVPLLLRCAQESGVGLAYRQGWSPEDSPIAVYSDEISKMPTFAEALSKSSSAFRELRS